MKKTWDEIQLLINQSDELLGSIAKLQERLDGVNLQILKNLELVGLDKIGRFVLQHVDKNIIKTLKKNYKLSFNVYDNTYWETLNKAEGKGFSLALGTARFNNIYHNTITTIPIIKLKYGFDFIEAQIISGASAEIWKRGKTEVVYKDINLNQDKYKEFLKREFKMLGDELLLEGAGTLGML